MSSDFNPSNCQIVQANIRTYSKTKAIDIAPMIGRIAFSQSIASPAWSGSATIVDGVGLLESFPLRGEEELDITLTSLDLNYTVELKTQIYKIDNVATTEINDGVSFNVYFVSKTSYNAGLRSITKSFRDKKASTIASQIFNDYYSEYNPLPVNESLPFDAKKYNLSGLHNKGRHLIVQPTNGALRTIIPSYGGGQAMNFLTRKSFSIITPSSSYKFFETFDGYHFVTEEFLIKNAIENKKIIKLFYDAFVSLEPSRAADQISTIETFLNSNRVDVLADINNGGYKSIVMEIDYIRRKVNENIFDFTEDAKYIDTTGAKTKISNDIHTGEFIKNTFNEENCKTVLIYKDYSQEGDIPGDLRADQYYSEIISRRLSQQHHMNSIGINIGIKGRLDITAGNLININASNFSGSADKKQNNQLSGNYLVQSVSHEVDKGILETVARLIKYDWSNE